MKVIKTSDIKKQGSKPSLERWTKILSCTYFKSLLVSMNSTTLTENAHLTI